MKRALTTAAVISIGIFPAIVSAGATYCPEGHSYIQVGMTESQVIAACGQPISKTKSNQQVTNQVPVTQLIYTSTIPNQPYPGIASTTLAPWSLPTGINNLYSIQFNIENNKVKSILVNNSGTNAMNICDGNSVKIGDPESNVYATCGAPDQTNKTYINEPIPGNNNTEVWIYQIDQYQPSIRLTFVNGSLESID